MLGPLVLVIEEVNYIKVKSPVLYKKEGIMQKQEKLVLHKFVLFYLFFHLFYFVFTFFLHQIKIFPLYFLDGPQDHKKRSFTLTIKNPLSSGPLLALSSFVN